MTSGPDDQRELTASRERFRDLVEAAPDGIVISRNGVVLYANPAALRILGCEEASELVGHPMTFLDGRAITTMRQRIQHMVETGERLVPHEYPATRRDGSVITAEIASIPIDFDGGPAVLAFARDVTERVALRARLEHADRLAALGAMAAGVAHEINNPLAFMGLAAEMLERKLDSAEQAELLPLAREVRIGLDRIAGIVRDLRVYGRYEDVAQGAVDLAGAIETAERLVAHEMRPRVKVRKDLAEAPAVRGVATRLEQVFVNLFLNATMAFEEDAVDPEVTVRVREEHDHVVVEVADNGPGIPQDLLERVFEPFFTTKSSGRGTGLGLAICRDIVTRAGGTIVARSELGRGTTMRLELRRAGELAEAPPPPLASTPQPTPERGRLLVIDDEPLIVTGLTRVLSKKYDVDGVTSAAAALERLSSGAQYDAVLCDLMMPGMTGMELYERVAAEHPGLEKRFAFVTGGAYTPRTRAFLETVSNPIVSKPFSAADLHRALAAVLARVT